MGLTLDGAVPVRLNDGRRKVRIPVRRHDQSEVHQTAEKDLVVFEEAADVVQVRPALERRAPRIRLQPRADVPAF